MRDLIKDGDIDCYLLSDASCLIMHDVCFLVASINCYHDIPNETVDTSTQYESGWQQMTKWI